MPLPTPDKTESREKFVSRCMSDPESKREFRDRDQRLAMCLNQYRRK